MKNNITVSYVNENNEQIKLSLSEINIHLVNEQVLTISSSHRQSDSGIAISDHSNSNEIDRAYALLQVTPCACNVIEVNTELCKD